MIRKINETFKKSLDTICNLMHDIVIVQLTIQKVAEHDCLKNTILFDRNIYKKFILKTKIKKGFFQKR